MDSIMRTVWAEIDLDKIAYNMKNIKKAVNEKDVIAVVKADAYGHGALDIVPTLLENGASRLAVAMITEALELRKNDIKVPIMILGYTPLAFADKLIENDIEQTVYDLEYVEKLSDIAIKLGKKAKVQIAVDTGMGRIGFIPSKKSVEDVKKISELDGIEIEGMFTHFSTSDEKDKTYTYEQFKKITDFSNELEKEGVKIPMKHVSNSGAIIDLPETYLDAVRAGIILYGYYPSEDVDMNKIDIKPALTLKTKVCHVKEVDKDTYISYGRKFRTDRNSKIATIPIGYADGYSRALSGKAKVIINGQFAPVVGRICMDQCMVDVTDLKDVKVGDEVILLGESGDLKFNADDMAEIMGTINYEIICMLKQRIPRVYKKNGQIVSTRNYL